MLYMSQPVTLTAMLEVRTSMCPILQWKLRHREMKTLPKATQLAGAEAGSERRQFGSPERGYITSQIATILEQMVTAVRQGT